LRTKTLFLEATTLGTINLKFKQEKEIEYMEYLVFIIYLIVVSQWIFEKKEKNAKSSTYSPHGRSHFRMKGLLNLEVGFVGLILFNLLLRDKGIIPVWSFWVGFVGFSLFVISGMVCMVKMFTATQP